MKDVGFRCFHQLQEKSSIQRLGFYTLWVTGHLHTGRGTEREAVSSGKVIQAIGRPLPIAYLVFATMIVRGKILDYSRVAGEKQPVLCGMDRICRE